MSSVLYDFDGIASWELQNILGQMMRDRRECRKTKYLWTAVDHQQDRLITKEMRAVRAELGKRRYKAQQRLPGF